MEKRKTFEKWPLMMNFLLAAIYDNGDASADILSTAETDPERVNAAAAECAPSQVPFFEYVHAYRVERGRRGMMNVFERVKVEGGGSITWTSVQ